MVCCDEDQQNFYEKILSANMTKIVMLALTASALGVIIMLLGIRVI